MIFGKNITKKVIPGETAENCVFYWNAECCFANRHNKNTFILSLGHS